MEIVLEQAVSDAVCEHVHVRHRFAFCQAPFKIIDGFNRLRMEHAETDALVLRAR